MTTFDKRKDAFESKFAHDQELQFKATARRNKLLGLWAAQKLGYSGDKADDYARSVIMADFEEVGDEDVIRKIVADFAAAQVHATEQEIRQKVNDFLAHATTEIKSGI